MFQQNPPPGKKCKWKWSDCEYALEKNKNRLCQDFALDSIFHRLLHAISLKTKRAGKQYPPTFSGEIWWEP